MIISPLIYSPSDFRSLHFADLLILRANPPRSLRAAVRHQFLASVGYATLLVKEGELYNLQTMDEPELNANIQGLRAQLDEVDREIVRTLN